jgi:hypothetical protein
MNYGVRPLRVSFNFDQFVPDFRSRCDFRPVDDLRIHVQRRLDPGVPQQLRHHPVCDHGTAPADGRIGLMDISTSPSAAMQLVEDSSPLEAVRAIRDEVGGRVQAVG